MATVVQRAVSASVTALSGTPTDVSFAAPVTDGNAIVCVVCWGADGSGSVSDAVNGSYTNHVDFNSSGGGRSVTIASFRGAAAVSTVSVTVTVSANGVIFLYEVNGLDNVSSPSTGTNENASGTSHVSAGTGLTGTNGFTVCGAMMASGSGETEGSGYSKFAETPSEARFSQWRTTSISSNQGPFTSAGAETSTAGMVFFADAGGPGGVVVRRGLRMMLGYGS